MELDTDLQARQEARDRSRRAGEAQKALETYPQEKLDGIVAAMAAAFELLPETKYTPVLRAAVYEGLYAVGAAVLHGTFRKRQRREEPIRKADTDYA